VVLFGTTFNVLKKTEESLVERLVTNTQTLPTGAYITSTNSHWITGVNPAIFSEKRTMLFHKGYSNMTGSAGCQTFPMAAGESFFDFAKGLKKFDSHSRYQYILIKI
jgi:hypothetical protein